MDHVYQQIQGWFDYEDVYAEMLRHVPSGGTIVEIGAWLGRSTAYMAVEIANSGKQVRFYTVDTWLGSPQEPIHMQIIRSHSGSIYELFLDNMRRGKLLECVRPIHLPSTEAAHWFESSSVDFCFIDAAHDFASVRNDILAWLPKIKPGGFLGGHDVNGFKVAPAVKSVLPWSEVRIVGASWLWTKPPVPPDPHLVNPQPAHPPGIPRLRPLRQLPKRPR